MCEVVFEDDKIVVSAVGEVGAGNAHVRFEVARRQDRHGLVLFRFQAGPIQQVGVNGVTNEALLAIVAYRLREFQSGKFACDENAEALEKVNDALAVLCARTKRRTQLGIEGTHTPDPVPPSLPPTEELKAVGAES